MIRGVRLCRKLGIFRGKQGGGVAREYGGEESGGAEYGEVEEGRRVQSAKRE